ILSDFPWDGNYKSSVYVIARVLTRQSILRSHFSCVFANLSRLWSGTVPYVAVVLSNFARFFTNFTQLQSNFTEFLSGLAGVQPYVSKLQSNKPCSRRVYWTSSLPHLTNISEVYANFSWLVSHESGNVFTNISKLLRLADFSWWSYI